MARPYAGVMIQVTQVPFEHSRALELWDIQQQEMVDRYGDAAIEPPLEAEGLIASFVGTTPAGETVATAAVRWARDPQNPAGAAEIKRLFVVAGHRGHGHSRVLMGAAEAAARRAGATSVVLETGTAQPEAIALYESTGYHRIPNYGYYRDDPESVCFARDLPTRVLIINGTIGAGKTTVAGALSTLLSERGARHGYIDGDFLCQAEPASPQDPYNQELFFANLAAVAPQYRARGCGIMILPRVVEDDADRGRYARAFATTGAPADVTIVRVTASESTRMDRITARDPEGHWREWGWARTVELEQVLEDAGLDDAVVANECRSPRETAEELLASIGW